MPVSEKKWSDLQRKMEALGIREEDLMEEFIRGSGAGGQKINKTSVAVQLTHGPSGIQIRCQEGRSQTMNRFYARRRLVEKLEEKLLGERSARQQRIEKIRRQKRKRSRRAQEKMLAEKRKVGEQKKLRRTPKREEE